MIDLLIAILIAIAVGQPCELGTSTDWYAWSEANPTAPVIMSLETDEIDALLFDAEGDSVLLFVFREDVSDTLDAGRSDPHGECARLIEPR